MSKNQNSSYNQEFSLSISGTFNGSQDELKEKIVEFVSNIENTENFDDVCIDEFVIMQE